MLRRSLTTSPYRLFFLLFVVVFAAAQQYLLFARVGVQYGGDTSRYLSGSEVLLKGEPLRAEQPAYVGYIAFFAAARALGLGEVGMVELQIGLSVLVLLALYAAGRSLVDEEIGLLAAVLYGVNWDVLNWNFYILTDGVYISALTLAAMLAVVAYLQRGRRLAILAGVLAVFAALLRPGGVILLPVFAWFLMSSLPEGTTLPRRIFLLLALGVLIFLVYYFPTRTRMASIDPLTLISNGEVVWEVVEWRVSMPPLSRDNLAGVSGVAQYCYTYPLACASLLGRRVLVYFGHVRAVYSLRHNLMIAFFYYHLYLFALIGAVAYRKRKSVQLVIALIGVHVAFFALAVPSVDGRFFAYIVPLISFLAALGVGALWQRLQPTQPMNQ